MASRWKIKPREFAEIFNGGKIIGSGGILLSHKQPKINLFSFDNYFSHPFAMMALNALKSGGVIAYQFLISGILNWSAWTKIQSTIVKSVAVFMIRVNTCIISNEPMHPNGGWFVALTSTNRIVSIIFFIVISEPRPSHQPFVIGCVNDGILAFGKRDQFDRLIKRLDDFVSSDSWFLHDLTSNKIVRRSAAFAF